MVKYINMSKFPSPTSGSALPPQTLQPSKKLPNRFISVTSLIGGLAVVGISWAFLDEINQTASVEGKHEEQADFSGETGNTKLSVVIISVGIIAVVLQLIISVGFWYWKEKDSKFLVSWFAIGQSITQAVLLICLGLIIYQFIKSRPQGASVHEQPKRANSATTGHGFWIILSANVIFHIGAILYLLRLVMKRSDEEQMEEMTAVVIHRRIPSRIPSSRIPSERTKRHGRMQK